MKIIFLQDYQGRETAGNLHKRGEVVDLSFPFAMELVKFGVAQEYEEEKPAKKAKVKDEPNTQ